MGPCETARDKTKETVIVWVIIMQISTLLRRDTLLLYNKDQQENRMAK